MIVSSRLLVPHKIDAKCGALPTSRLPITNRGKPAFRSLRDEALTKFGEFIGAGRELSFCDSPCTLCEAAIGMIRRSIPTVHIDAPPRMVLPLD